MQPEKPTNPAATGPDPFRTKRSKSKMGIVSLQFYSYPDEVGGAWKLTYEVNRRLVERGHRVYLITCKPTQDFPGYEVVDGIHYYRIGVEASKSVAGLIRESRRILNLILDQYPVHLAHIHNPLVEFAALATPRFWPIPKAYHFHSLWHDEEEINRRSPLDGREQSRWSFRLKLGARLNLIRLIEWTCFATARGVLFLSQYSKSRFEDFFPLKKPRLKIIPGGVDVEAFRPGAAGLSAMECRRRLELPLGGPLLLTVRRLAARMGLANLVSACALVARRNPRLEFLLAIVGKGPMLDQLNDQIRELGLQNRVRLVGSASTGKLSLYYEAADLFVLPSAALEGFGLATVEALACGLPVLGTPVGGTVEILNAIDPKLLLESATPEAIANGLETFLKNPQPFLDLKNRCRQEAVRKYGWETVVDSLEEEFYEIVGDGL